MIRRAPTDGIDWGAPIDRGHPEGRGLDHFFYSFAGVGFIDVVDRSRPTRIGTADPGRWADDGGQDSFFDGNGDGWTFGTHEVLNTGRPFTICWEAILDSFVDSFPAIVHLVTDSNEVGVMYSNSGLHPDVEFTSFVGSTWARTRLTLTDGLTPTGQRHFGVLTYNGADETSAANFNWWINGRKIAPITGDALGGTGVSNRIGHGVASVLDWNGSIRQVRIYDYAWDGALARSFARSPAGVFRPATSRTARTTVVAAAGGTTPKGPLGHPFHGPFAGPIAA